jgi:hypothetical protein
MKVFATMKIVSIAVSKDTDILLPRRANDDKDKELPKWILPLTLTAHLREASHGKEIRYANRTSRE